jgi:ABC-type uncharacterized transport system permease subunit
MSLPISNNRAASAGSAYYTPKREKKLGESAVAMPDSEISQLLALTATGAAALYLYAAARQLLRLEKREDTLPKAVLIPGLLALALHGLVIYTGTTSVSASFGFYKVASITFWLMGVLSVAIVIARPMQTLLIAIFPLAAISLLVATLTPETARPMTETPRGLLLHISTSIIAYALFGLGMLQGLLVLQQSRLLRQHKTRGLIRRLPPLDATEQLMFELILSGTVILSVSIVAGIYYVQDLFAQHLIHKTVLTVIAWIVYAILTVGHIRHGWRVNTAVMLCGSGFALLTVGFYGSKLVLELVLS